MLTSPHGETYAFVTVCVNAQKCFLFIFNSLLNPPHLFSHCQTGRRTKNNPHNTPTTHRRHTHTRTHTHTYTHTHTHTHTHTYTHTYTLIHTHTHTHTQMHFNRRSATPL